MATIAPGYSRWKLTKGERRNLAKGLLFISPWLVGFLLLLAYPIFYTVRMSFTKYSGFGEAKWIGLQNYRDLMHDNVFWTAVYNTLYYTGLAVPIGVVVALTLAIAMNQPLPEVRIYRAIFYLPAIIPIFTLTQTFQILMSPTQGVFNRILIFFGLPNINWFGNPAYAKIGLVLLAQYGAGTAALIFLAGLKGIPRSLYEAAEIDGATGWRRFWNITIPLTHSGHTLRHHSRHQRRSPGLHADLHSWRQSCRWPRKLHALVRAVSLYQWIYLLEIWLRCGDGLDSLHRHRCPGSPDLLVIFEMGEL